MMDSAHSENWKNVDRHYAKEKKPTKRIETNRISLAQINNFHRQNN